MKIDRLELTNFGPFEQAALEFKPGLIGIFGADIHRSNGSGKSTLLEAIPWAWFGRSQRGGVTELLRTGADHMQVQLTYGDHDLIRSWAGGTKLKVDGHTGRLGEIQAELQDSLGLSYLAFLASSFFLQGESDRFTAAGSADRLGYLREILGLLFWDECQVRAVRYLKDAEADASEAEAAVEALDGSIRQAKTDSQKLKVVGAVRKIEQLTRKRDKLLDQKIELAKQEQAATAAQKSLEQLAGKLLDLESDQGRIGERRERLELQLQEIGAGPVTMYLNAGEWREHYGEQITAQREEMATRTVFIAGDREFIHGTHGESCPTCRRPWPAAEQAEAKASVREMLQIRTAEYEQLDQELAQLVDKFTEANRQVTQNNEAAVRLEQLKQVPEIRTRLSDLEQESDRLHKAAQAALEELAATQVQAKGLEGVTARYEALGAEISEVEAELDGIKQAVAAYDQAKERIAQLTKRRDATEETRVQADRDAGILTQLSQHFGKTGLPLWRVRQAVERELEPNANEVLGEILPEYRVEFQFDAEAGRNNLEIGVRTPGGVRLYETFSGGEKEILNFAVRMALSRLLRNRAGTPFEFVVLDEVFGMLDEGNKGRLEAILTVLREEFRQIFVVSHRPVDLPLDQTVVIHRDGQRRRIESDS